LAKSFGWLSLCRPLVAGLLVAVPHPYPSPQKGGEWLRDVRYWWLRGVRMALAARAKLVLQWEELERERQQREQGHGCLLSSNLR
nr:hypothetical protein [Prevotella sp.]